MIRINMPTKVKQSQERLKIKSSLLERKTINYAIPVLDYKQCYLSRNGNREHLVFFVIILRWIKCKNGENLTDILKIILR